MVTPISDMLELWLTDNKKSAYIPRPSSDLIPIDTPLMASGYSAGGMEYLSDKMQDFHMIPFRPSPWIRIPLQDRLRRVVQWRLLW